MCDGVAECEFDSDEYPCTSCNQGAWLCVLPATSTCYPDDLLSWVCSNSSLSDICGNTETLCDQVSCDLDQCENGDCMDPNWRCNGNVECLDGSDEQFCNETCTLNTALCGNFATCTLIDAVPTCLCDTGKVSQVSPQQGIFN